MPLFNKSKRASRETTNYMGAKAYETAPEYQLVSLLLTSFVQDSYYRSAGKTTLELGNLLETVDPRFAAQAALYARNEIGMRSVSHLLAAALAPKASGTDWGRRFYDRIVRRPDDMLEIAAAYRHLTDGPANLTNAMKKGFAASFDRFDGYQLAKYRGQGKEIKLIDVVNLVRPVPTQRNAKALQQLVAGTLRNTDTWEAKLSEAGSATENKQEAKSAAWAELLRGGKLGYMALLRNLRNLLEADLTEADFGQLLAQLTDEKSIKRSLQFPFRFLSAYAEVEKLGKENPVSKDGNKPFTFLRRFLPGDPTPVDQSDRMNGVLQALEFAVNVSVKNLPDMPGKTAILTDNSGSMRGDAGGASAVSAMSKRTTADIANLFSVLFRQRCESTYIGLFGDRLIDGEVNPQLGVFENFQRLNRQAAKCGPGTETGIFLFFERLVAQREMVDRIIIFSDMQIGTGCSWYTTDGKRGNDFMALYQKYRKINPAVRVYSVDLRGYGSTVFKNGEYKISGWSDKIFEVMDRCEQDPTAMLSAIRAVEL